ncbi:mechanosensitive ion channel domain-containing protein [Mariniblastus fucicola]|uniref:mechanosensitive ion channel domain-containing protein n=1 Tax=Mariniblastus fucicola TaxID=980251 RepID=UPI0011DFC65B|nr:mechanosensitive ion channel domain-containing protein [Mariniblastus fucicola]
MSHYTLEKSSRFCVWILCVIAFSNGLNAEQQPEADQRSQLKRETSQLAEAIALLPAETADKSQLEQRVSAIDAAITQSAETAGEIARLQEKISNADARSKQLAAEIAELKSADPKAQQDLAKSDLAELKAKQAEVQAELSRLRTESTQLDTAMANVVQSRQKIEQELTNIDARKEQATETTTPVGDSIPERLAKLENSVALYRLSLLRQKLQLQNQWSVVNEQLDIDQQRSELVGLQIKQLEASNTTLTDAIATLRQKEARDMATQASEKASQIRENYPLLASSEDLNVEIADKNQKREKEFADAAQQNRSLLEQLVDVRDKYRDTQARISAIGRSNTVGAMLRKRKSELPSMQKRQQQVSLNRDKIEEIQFDRFQISEQLAELSMETIRKETEVAAGREIALKDWEKLEKPVEQLIERRKESLRSLDKILDRLFLSYLDIETNNSRLSDVVSRFNDYINERILWLRSNKLLFSELKIDEADKVLLSPKDWVQNHQLTLHSFRSRSWLFGPGAILIIALLVLRSRMRRRVDAFGVTASRGSCATFWPTGRAAILTLLISVTIPLIAVGAGLGFRQTMHSGSVLFEGLANALVTAGLFALPLEVLRRVCRKNGLAPKHFDWPDEAVGKLKRHLSWYVLPASMLVFAVSLLIQLDTAHRVDLPERILFVIAMLLTTLLVHRIFSPATGIFSQYLKRRENSWANQTSATWFTLILLVPVSMALLAIVGYYYTAINLTRCLCFTFAFGVSVELIRALIRRFVLVRRRAAHIESARRKRAAEIEAEKEARKKAAAERKRRIEAGEEVEDMNPVMSSESLADLQFEKVDIAENAGQANQLIRLLGWTAWLIGLWLVWSDVLPALKALDEYKLWETTQTASAETDASGLSALMPQPAESSSAQSGTDEKTQPSAPSDPLDDGGSTTETTKAKTSAPMILLDPPENDGVSLRDFLVFIVISLLTFFAARNLPNAFEMLFLDELPVDRSARFASKALFSYAIVIIGTALALKTLSINWTSIQWLVTALTFGLAFGLQEIFANFVAGIILMFERPMRIGDLITVDEFTGVVSRIRTRATTIVNWDRKEYVIPNKDFITGRLINWTLSDAINRIQLTVGIAYGSDVAKAKRIIFDICKEHRSIVEEPATSITFEEFADSSLNLVVRTFLGDIDSRLSTVDSLHMRINTAFAENGIEISFPQRDLNLRSIDDDVARYFPGPTGLPGDAPRTAGQSASAKGNSAAHGMDSK